MKLHQPTVIFTKLKAPPSTNTLKKVWVSRPVCASWSKLQRGQVPRTGMDLVSVYLSSIRINFGFPGGSGVKNPRQCKRCRRCGFDSWVGKIPWRRAWQPTPVFLPGESHGRRSLVGYSPQGCKELDMTEHARMQDWFHSHTFTVFSRPKGTQVDAVGYLMFTKNGEKGIISWNYLCVPEKEWSPVKALLYLGNAVRH